MSSVGLADLFCIKKSFHIVILSVTKKITDNHSFNFAISLLTEVRTDDFVIYLT